MRKKIRDLFAVFLVAILGLLIINGLFRAIVIRREITKSVWNGQASLAIAINSKPPSVAIYQKDPQKITFFTIPGELEYATGIAGDPVKSVDSLFSLPGPEATGVLTNLLGINVANHFYYNLPPEINENSYTELFKDFASIKTPIGLLLGRVGDVGRTNLTSAEIFHLWWQVKGLFQSQVELSTLASYSEEILGAGDLKFKGIDREKTTEVMGKYFYDTQGKEYKITIRNASGVVGASRLAGELLESYGWTIEALDTAEVEPRTYIIGNRKDAESEDLAKLFSCDIVSTQYEPNQGKVTIVLGEDFAARYF